MSLLVVPVPVLLHFQVLRLAQGMAQRHLTCTTSHHPRACSSSFSRRAAWECTVESGLCRVAPNIQPTQSARFLTRRTINKALPEAHSFFSARRAVEYGEVGTSGAPLRLGRDAAPDVSLPDLPWHGLLPPGNEHDISCAQILALQLGLRHHTRGTTCQNSHNSHNITHGVSPVPPSALSMRSLAWSAFTRSNCFSAA